MRYVIADRKLAAGCGIAADGHRTWGSRILLNEKEVTAFAPGRTFADKAAAVDGVVRAAAEMKRILKEEGWR